MSRKYVLSVILSVALAAIAIPSISTAQEFITRYDPLVSSLPWIGIGEASDLSKNPLWNDSTTFLCYVHGANNDIEASADCDGYGRNPEYTGANDHVHPPLQHGPSWQFWLKKITTGVYQWCHDPSCPYISLTILDPSRNIQRTGLVGGGFLKNGNEIEWSVMVKATYGYDVNAVAAFLDQYSTPKVE